MNSVKNDLTEGSIGRKLISFFLPIAAGTLSNSFITLPTP